ncbi:MAG TPA: hypothetical protein VJU01_04445 [Gaiellaceae bacterium]|nr:hypothetical protein [Gaiellaceae bacterium]
MEWDEPREPSGARETRETTDEDISLVAEQVRAGTDQETIVAMLEDRGVDRMQARALVETLYPQLARVAEQERYTGSALGPGIAGGLVAAIVGGFLWGLIVILTEYEVGIAAWGIGFLAGFGVVRFAGGAKGTPLQVVAVISSLLGIVIGKYISYAYFFKQAVEDRFNVDISYFDSEIFRAFRENLGDIFGGFDLIWAGFAIATAWRIARPSRSLSRGRLGV